MILSAQEIETLRLDILEEVSQWTHEDKQRIEVLVLLALEGLKQRESAPR